MLVKQGQKARIVWYLSDPCPRIQPATAYADTKSLLQYDLIALLQAAENFSLGAV